MTLPTSTNTSALAEPAAVDKLVAELKIRPDRAQEAKDILRAFGMRLLPVDDPHVKSDLAKIEKAQSSFRR
ncbi:MAG: hypothetical protein WBZ37_24535 [Mycobacterium sp.]